MKHIKNSGGKKMKKIISSVLVAVMALSLVACGSSKDASKKSDSAKSTDTDVLSIYLASEPAKIDPALNSSVDGGCLAVNSFTGLYTYDKDCKLVPALSDGEAEVSEDGLTYTFKLIESKWSDGTELTAKDFVYSWNRAADEKTAADYGYLFDIIDRNDDGTLAVTAEDDYTLTVKLTNVCPYFLDLCAFPTFMPVPQASVEAADSDGTNPGAWAQEAGFVCNGAYTLEKWKHNESMVYVKNDNYYDAENVTMNELHFMLSDDQTATYAAYNSGDLDFIDEIPSDEIQSLIDNKEFHVSDQLGTYYITFNVNSSLFDGLTTEQAAKMREAMSLMIDRDYIVDTIEPTNKKVADSFVPYGMTDGNGSEFKTESYFDAEKTGAKNAEKAMKLLEECGYSFKDKGDGSYEISPALSFEYLINTLDSHQKIAEAVQQDLAVLGIEVKIQSEDWNVFLEDRKQGKFDVARDGWVADYNDPINMLELFTSDSGNNNAQFGKGDGASAPDWTEYDSLIASIRTESDLAKRAEMMHQAEDILMSTYAVVPVYFYNDPYMQKSNVDGIYVNVFGMKYFMYSAKK